jgi:AcrR family transcriptional regulator
MAPAGPLPHEPALPGWAPHVPAHAPGVRSRSGNAMGRTRAGLLDGAGRAFAERGLRGSTMQSVAAAAGVAKATLYNHFRTKDDVARALLAAELDRLTALAGRLPPTAALTALADEVAAHPVLRRLADDEPAVLTALLTTTPQHWAALVRRLAVALRAEPTFAELAARWLLGLVLQPGETGVRRATAERLAGLLPS